MVPFISPLERSLIHEITQLKAELAHYRKRDESRTIVPVWQDAKILNMASIMPTINTMELCAEACSVEDSFGLHVKGRAKGGMHVGYYLSRAELAKPAAIQAQILDSLMADVGHELASQLANYEKETCYDQA